MIDIGFNEAGQILPLAENRQHLSQDRQKILDQKESSATFIFLIL